MFVAFVLAAAQQVADSPPPVRAVPVAPPPVITPVAPPAPPTMAPNFAGLERAAVMVSVRATLGNSVLLDDRFRVGRAPATFMQNRSEAAPDQCGKAWSGLRRHVNFGLRADGPEHEDRYRLNFSLNRPNGSCETDGVRGLSVEQPVVLKPGQTVTVDGDGGLKITLRRL